MRDRELFLYSLGVQKTPSTVVAQMNTVSALGSEELEYRNVASGFFVLSVHEAVHFKTVSLLECRSNLQTGTVYFSNLHNSRFSKLSSFAHCGAARLH